MPFKIAKRFDFSASHQLEGLPTEHQCARLHGHNYSVTMHLQAETVDEIGFVKDYGELSFVKEFIDRVLDHRHLNAVCGFNPTAENIAAWLFKNFRHDLPQLWAVEVKETEKTTAIYYE